jgi:thiamine-monophosphate kinase
MRIHDIGGELGLIERIRETHGAAIGDGLVLGLGDDAAIIEVPKGNQLVVTTDMLVERIHFRKDWSDYYSIGWKAAAVNLSDLAAMGAKPTFAFLSIAFTSREKVENLDRIYDGFADCLNRYGARIAGGDTNCAPDNLVLSVTQLGNVVNGRALRRTGAKQGDLILVTGTLGESAAGLALLTDLGAARAEKVDKGLLNTHRRPQPRVMAAVAAAATGKVHAAMDLSDGLLGDVKKLCAASKCGAKIDATAIPTSDTLRQVADLLGKDILSFALDGGEDFELLLVVAPEDLEAVSSAITDTGTPVTVVGEIVKSGVKVVGVDGVELNSESAGWDHFGL